MSYTIRQLRIDDADYPVHLRSISKAPQLLYYIGDISLISTPLIGIVGTRRGSPYGRWAAKEIASAVARCGIPVVSGMAEGGGMHIKLHRQISRLLFLNGFQKNIQEPVNRTGMQTL